MIEFDRALDARCDCFQELAAAVRSSKKSRDPAAGKRAHSRILASAHKHDRYLANLLIEMYGSFGDLISARAVFDSLHAPNVFSWTLLLAAYADAGHLSDAAAVFDAMPERCAVTWNTMIAAYSRSQGTREAAALLANMPQPDVVSWTTVLTAYANVGHLEKAKLVFHSMPCWNSQSWNVMIGAFCRSGEAETAQRFLNAMPNPDIVSWNHLLLANAQTGHMGNARDMFNSMPLHDIASWTTMLTACFHHEKLETLKETFDEMPEWNVVAWNALVAANAQKGHCGSTKRLFDSLPERDIFSWNSMLAAYAQSLETRAAREILDSMPEHDVISWNTMIAAYSHDHSHLEDARVLFDQMPARDIVSWNSMIAAYARNGRGDEALDFFAAIDPPGARNEATFASALDACSDRTALASGVAIHAQIARGDGSNSTTLANALIHMYGKCGSLDRAAAVFKRMWRHNEVSWSSMIAALDRNGESARAVALLPITSLEGAVANEITFTAILTACSHLGMIEAAFQCFVSLGQDYGVEHRVQHYACIVDLLGRSGWLPEAEDLILAMPYEPDPMTVASLLGACKLQGDAQCGGRAVRRHHKHMASSGPFVLISELAADVSPRHCTQCTV